MFITETILCMLLVQGLVIAYVSYLIGKRSDPSGNVVMTVLEGVSGLCNTVKMVVGFVKVGVAGAGAVAAHGAPVKTMYSFKKPSLKEDGPSASTGTPCQ